MTLSRLSLINAAKEKTMSRSHASRHAPKKKQHHPRHRKHNKNLRWLWLLPVALVVGLVLFLILGNQGVQGEEITVAEAYSKYQAGVFLLDVRTQEEWDEQHVPDSTWIDQEELLDRAGELPTDQEIMIICNSGRRSRESMKDLLKAGFTQVSSVSGGITAWAEAGYPVEP